MATCVFVFSFPQSREKARRRGSSVHTQRGTSASEHLFRVHLHVCTSAGMFARPYVCRVMQSGEKKGFFRDFLLTVGQQGIGRWEDENKGRNKGRKQGEGKCGL